MNRSPLHEMDARALVHQQTDLDDHQRNGAVLIDRGEGVRVWDVEGREYIEAMAGLWSASLGFSEPRLAQAAYDQMMKLPFYHTFFGKGHGPAVELADKLLAVAPVPMGRVLFQCSGSEANDTAIKLAWYYNVIRGKPEKRKIIGRVRGYHGNTVASVSLSGQPHMYAGFNLPLPGFLHADNPNYYRFAEAGESEEAFSKRMAANLEALILAEGPETIAAMFVEPVQGGGGAITPPAGYFEAIQPVLKRHDILLVADEVICGFGRTGNYWGSQTYGIKPDMLACAKQLSASYQPISALMISEEIFDMLVEGSRRNGSFGHGYTYGGHPVACAVALETLKIYEERDIVDHVREVSPTFLAELEACRDHPLVGDVRGVGLIAGAELMADKASKTPFPPERKAGPMVEKACLENGLIVRAIGDRIAFTPPLIISDKEIVELFRRFRIGLDTAYERMTASQAA
ncbi:aminotransferase [Phenylobacterium sp.]|uniref:aminotransferase n=1 Tax=Phenylobacterium sp. TaxID=1871053 RepID=UPI0035AFFC6A